MYGLGKQVGRKWERTNGVKHSFAVEFRLRQRCGWGFGFRCNTGQGKFDRRQEGVPPDYIGITSVKVIRIESPFERDLLVLSDGCRKITKISDHFFPPLFAVFWARLVDDFSSSDFATRPPFTTTLLG